MKKSPFITALITAGTFACAPLFAGSDSYTGHDDDKAKHHENSTEYSQRSHDSMTRYGDRAMNRPRVQAIEESQLEDEVTANDLIGETVYSEDGKELGEIVDLTLSDTNGLKEQDSMNESSWNRDDNSRDRSNNLSRSGRSDVTSNQRDVSSSSTTDEYGIDDEFSSTHSSTVRHRQRSEARDEGTSRSSMGESDSYASNQSDNSEQNNWDRESRFEERTQDRVNSAMNRVDGASIVVETNGDVSDKLSHFEVSVSELRRNGDGELTLAISSSELETISNQQDRSEVTYQRSY